MTTLLRTGARINQVDEEGEVTLFCYSLGRTFSFRVGGSDEARRCKHCNGTGTIELVDLGDGILLTPEQARSRREADERISQSAAEHERRKRSAER